MRQCSKLLLSSFLFLTLVGRTVGGSSPTERPRAAGSVHTSAAGLYALAESVEERDC